MALIWKKGLFFPYFSHFLVNRAKTQKFLLHISHLHTYTYFAHPIDFFAFPILHKKNANSSCMVSFWCDSWCLGSKCLLQAAFGANLAWAIRTYPHRIFAYSASGWTRTRTIDTANWKWFIVRDLIDWANEHYHNIDIELQNTKRMMARNRWQRHMLYNQYKSLWVTLKHAFFKIKGYRIFNS